MNVDKIALRATMLARRSSLSAATVATAAAAVSAHVVSGVRSAGARRICAYVPVGSEPGALTALEELRLVGIEVLLPVLRADLDLDWAPYDGPASLVSVDRGLRQPSGRRCGVDAITAVDLVIAPALAVDRIGNRLGRGGGSYDRALARVARDVPVVALLHDGERLDSVPHDRHDHRVTHTVTPAQGWQRVTEVDENR